MYEVVNLFLLRRLENTLSHVRDVREIGATFIRRRMMKGNDQRTFLEEKLLAELNSCSDTVPIAESPDRLSQ